MQDRLLCRAKDMKTGDWVNGFYRECSKIVFACDGIRKNLYHTITPEKAQFQKLPHECEIDIDKDTLCQSTGRRIGEEIVWEKDLLKVVIKTTASRELEVIFLVFWSEERLRWELKYVSGYQYFDEDLWALSWLFALVEDYRTIEIIGNAIDNKELLNCEEDLEN